ncbi:MULTISPECIES: RAMP superfamily CRISPR-associated protein [unclassified Microcoleus]|uniref:RAMP superfamily CRISPR-associated protein n=1 Tax=unclassified Microcoleus TaxID=2642155 RepID=UPI0025D8FEF0|nr:MULTISPECIES: RAMP superfamily CRISPR-associated protein [unclassified Microcoleus]
MNQERLNRNQHPIAKRIIVRGILILDTPTCLGSGDADSPTDLALLRDSVSDCALLTGASITGALRNYLRECEHGYGAGEQNCDRATTLFGGTRRDPDGEKSPLIINDAISSKIPVIELRDGVAIESITGTAKKGQKYDLELLAAGTEFQLGFELSIEKNLSQSQQQALINLLALVLRGLEHGDISIGMKKRRGFGSCHVKNWQVWNFHLENPDERMAWLKFEHWHRGLLPDRETYSSIATALGVSLENEKDQRDRFLIHATFNLVGSLLIRSGQDSTGRAPDVVHLKSHRPNESESQSILSGTSLAGVLRHRAERIVKTFGSCSPIVDKLFGFVAGKQSQASRLVVHEKVIKDTTDLVQNRIAIDRFTGGAYHGALFDEQPIFGGDETRVCIELELRNPKDYEIGLLLLLLKDLWTSDLPVGGESSIGRGRLKGIKADLIHHHPQNPQQWEISEENGNLHVTNKADKGGSGESVRETLQGFVEELLVHLGKEVEV